MITHKSTRTLPNASEGRRSVGELLIVHAGATASIPSGCGKHVSMKERFLPTAGPRLIHSTQIKHNPCTIPLPIAQVGLKSHPVAEKPVGPEVTGPCSRVDPAPGEQLPAVQLR